MREFRRGWLLKSDGHRGWWSGPRVSLLPWSRGSWRRACRAPDVLSRPLPARVLAKRPETWICLLLFPWPLRAHIALPSRCHLLSKRASDWWLPQSSPPVLCLRSSFGGGFPGNLVLQNLPTMQETWVWSLGREDPLEEEMATHSRILAWEIPWREEPGRLQSMGSQRIRHNWVTIHFHFLSLFFVGTNHVSPC